MSNEMKLHLFQVFAFPIAFLIGTGILLLLEGVWHAFDEWLKEIAWKEYQMEKYGRIVYGPESGEPNA